MEPKATKMMSVEFHHLSKAIKRNGIDYEQGVQMSLLKNAQLFFGKINA
jgi:hypothetical protein